MKETIASLFRESAGVYTQMADGLSEATANVASRLIGLVGDGHKILVFGNGGSACDAQHFACEMVGRFLKERRGLPVIALTTNTSNLTAIANDYEYAAVFRRQVEALGRPGDAAIGISTSGRSPNVVQALGRARELGLLTIALTGAVPGPAGEVADLVLAVPSRHTPRIQEGHLAIVHALCQMIEESL